MERKGRVNTRVSHINERKIEKRKGGSKEFMVQKCKS